MGPHTQPGFRPRRFVITRIHSSGPPLVEVDARSACPDFGLHGNRTPKSRRRHHTGGQLGGVHHDELRSCPDRTGRFSGPSGPTWKRGGDSNEARRCGLGQVGATFMTPGDVGGRIMPSEATCRVWKPPAPLSYFVVSATTWMTDKELLGNVGAILMRPDDVGLDR